MKKEKLWQDNESGTWFSDQKQKCASCGKEVNCIIEFKLPDGLDLGRFCFLTESNCSFVELPKIFKSYPETDFILIREIEYKKGIRSDG